MKKRGVWVWELDRFGYDLVSIGKTKKEAQETMLAEYIDTYAKLNGLDREQMVAAIGSPILDEDGEIDEYDPYNEFVAYYRAVLAEEPRFYEYGKVEWE